MNLRKVWNDVCCVIAENSPGFTPEKVLQDLRDQGWKVKTFNEIVIANRYGSAVISKSIITSPDGRSTENDKTVAKDYDTARRAAVREYFSRKPV